MTLYFLHFGKPFFPCFSSPQNELGKWIRPWGAWWWSQFSWAIWRVVLFLSGIQFQNWPGAWFHEEQLHPDFQWNFPLPWLNHWQADDNRCQSVAESDTDRSIGRIWCCLLDCLWILSRAGAGLLTILLQGFHLCWEKHSKVENFASHVKHLNHQHLENYITMLFRGDIRKQYIQIYYA